MRPQLALMLAAFVCLAACKFDASSDLTCNGEGEVENGRVCSGGLWVAMDAAGLPDATPDAAGGDVAPDLPPDEDAADMGGADADMQADMACVAEDNATFCARIDAECDEITAPDNCGEDRTITCGACTDPETCGADGLANTCSCVAETDLEFCTRLVKNCDEVTELDNCGQQRVANCGACTAPATCGGGGTANVCACGDQTDQEFCDDYAAVCGALTAVDACDQMRTTDCGSCMSPEMCGAVTANQCDCGDDTAVCGVITSECGVTDVSASCNNIASVDCGGCQTDATCDGSNACQCDAGFTADGLGNCADDDECALGLAMCDPNASCMNLPGTFSCTCDAGYMGNGTTCSDLDECLNVADNNCDANATCTNEVGSFSCACNSGYSGNGVMCADDDECATPTDNDCDANATCTNLPGTFSCACNQGYAGDGVTCTLITAVVSVQTVSVIMADGTSSDSVNLRSNINSANAIPFISLRASTGNIDATTVDVTLADDKVDFTRNSGSGIVQVVVAVVEFDSSFVQVQSSTFGGEGAQSISTVDPSKAFVTFAAAIDENTDAVDDRMLSAELGASSVTIGRSSTAGSISGQYWVAEAQNDEFNVQHLSGAIGAADTSTTFAITSVDLASSFLVYSYRSDEPNAKFDRAAVSCELNSATEVGCVRGDTGAGKLIEELHVQVIEFPGLAVQRGTSSFTGTDVRQQETVVAVDTARATANLGQTGSNGACSSQTEANDGFPTIAAVVELADATTLNVDRSIAADGETECTWEVIEWP